ncbi:MAG TPA: AMP-binding protein [Polyangiales bacterium]|nr:AMP-binding protein [Polyangiales bacterium]
MGLQVGQVLCEAARRSPNACAVVDLGHVAEQRRELSYAALHGMACEVARVLAFQGVGRGDRVALVAENSAEAAAAWFGVVYCGAAVVPMHLLSSASELSERFAHAGVKVVLHDQPRSSVVSKALAESDARALCLEKLDLLAPRALEANAVRYPLDMSAADTAMVLYTSGTTGRPKGAAISHASLLLHTLLLLNHALCLDERSRVLCVLPLSHSYGCRLAMLAPFYARARVVIMPRFDATRCLHMMRAEEVTWFPGVPTMFTALGQLGSDGQDISASAHPPRMQWALCAGAPLADETVRRAEAVLGVEVRQGYGMTEATFSTMNAPPDRRVIGSVGKPAWGVELRIVDAEGSDVPQGQTGQVLVRGPNVMTGYLLDAEATAEALSDGWVHSGDVGVLDDEGRLRIVDRIKDLIIRGGYNVYPSEVENALGAHPDVHDVAVIGRPDAFYGEEVVAVVVPRDSAVLDVQALHRFVAERVSRTKLPREYALVSQLPLGASGKIHKRTLRDQLLAGQLEAEKISG